MDSLGLTLTWEKEIPEHNLGVAHSDFFEKRLYRVFLEERVRLMKSGFFGGGDLKKIGNES